MGALAALAMLFFPLSGLERALIILSIALVLTLELANTALERVMDILKPRIHPYARVIKDMMAGAVLLTTLAAIAIGIAIFSPYVLAALRFSNSLFCLSKSYNTRYGCCFLEGSLMFNFEFFLFICERTFLCRFGYGLCRSSGGGSTRKFLLRNHFALLA